MFSATIFWNRSDTHAAKKKIGQQLPLTTQGIFNSNTMSQPKRTQWMIQENAPSLVAIGIDKVICNPPMTVGKTFLSFESMR